MSQQLKALLIGESHNLMFGIPHILSRAGFSVDIIANNKLLKNNKFVENFILVRGVEGFVPKIDSLNLENYDLIIVIDDATLMNIKNSNLAIEKKLRVLPITEKKYLNHIGSKAELSNFFHKAGIKTPAFFLANNFSEAVQAAEDLQYPVIVKIDFSGGGVGVFECKNFSDLNSLEKKIFDSRTLIQKKIIGTEYDLSAFFREEVLIHFGSATIKQQIRKFGPSSIRQYTQIGTLNEAIFHDLTNLGKALGANGFVNIAAIKSDEDGEFYFIEADMRPIAWADFTKFIGDDLALKISKWFSEKKGLELPLKINPNYPEKLVVPNFLRLSTKEILCNHFNVWNYMSKDDWAWFIKKEFSKILRFFYLKITRIPTVLIKMILPKKEDRRRIKAKLKNSLGFIG
jgi:hypothetical protein